MARFYLAPVIETSRHGAFALACARLALTCMLFAAAALAGGAFRMAALAAVQVAVSTGSLLWRVGAWTAAKAVIAWAYHVRRRVG